MGNCGAEEMELTFLTMIIVLGPILLGIREFLCLMRFLCDVCFMARGRVHDVEMQDLAPRNNEDV